MDFVDKAMFLLFNMLSTLVIAFLPRSKSLLISSQEEWVMEEISDKTWSTGEGKGNPLQYSCLENLMNSMKRQNDRILKEQFTRSISAQYATGDQWRNNSRKDEGMKPKQKQYQLWMWLVIEARSDAIKSNIA